MLTPEESQKLTDLRAKMLANIQNGLPSAHGITPEEIQQGLSFLRQNRAPAAKAAKAKREAKPAKQSGPVDLSAFADFDLD